MFANFYRIIIIEALSIGVSHCERFWKADFNGEDLKILFHLLFHCFLSGRPTIDIGGGVPSIGLPGYDALEDPHLHEYFSRRFSNVPRLSSVS